MGVLYLFLWVRTWVRWGVAHPTEHISNMLLCPCLCNPFYTNRSSLPSCTVLPILNRHCWSSFKSCQRNLVCTQPSLLTMSWSPFSKSKGSSPGKFMPFFHKFLQGAAATVSISPIPGVQAAIQLVDQIITGIENVKMNRYGFVRFECTLDTRN